MFSFYATHIPNRYAAENPFRNQQPEYSPVPTFEQARPLLPVPFWDGHASAIDCYWKVWQIAFKNLRQPGAENGFVSNYIDTAFNNHLFMWDSAFILMFARYGDRAFNFQRTLDNLYAKQHPDGFICREIDMVTGGDAFARFDPAATGPDVMGWSEWEYYLNFGDRSRLEKVFPALLAYHQWFHHFRTWQDGTYWASGFACGMDNQPRLRDRTAETRLIRSFKLDAPPDYTPYEWWDHDHMSWIDTCLQAILSARVLVDMARVLGRETEVVDLVEEIEHLSRIVNMSMWDDQTGFYYDRQQDGTLSTVKTIGAYWALLAEIVPAAKLNHFINHLRLPEEFNRPHRVPSLSADHPIYHPQGSYWRGGVWPPTNYMVLRGLTKAGYHALAHEIGINHHTNVVKIFEQTGTVWENYAPEKIERGNIAAPNFVGWSGLPPVAVLFEYVFGLRPDVLNRRLVWDVRLTDAHGVRQYPFGGEGVLDLHCAERIKTTDKPVVEAVSTIPLTLEIIWEGSTEIRAL